MAFTPVQLTKDGESREATTAEEETKLRFDGWRSAPSGKKAPANKPADNK